jgi:hypothetical protein
LAQNFDIIMERFHIFEWNKWDKEYSMIILSEEDIKNEINLRGAGFEILVIPNKFENTSNEYLDFWKKITLMRSGRIIYI